MIIEGTTAIVVGIAAGFGIALIGFFLGILLFPLVVFLRARSDGAWDDSNMTNIYRLIAHIGAHPSDFAKMRYIGDGKDPFWYISKDELSDIVDTRPPKD